MEFYSSRAMQVAYLEHDQLERLHQKEKSIGYCLPNWNIQSLLGIGNIKDQFGIPDDDNAQARHKERVESEIRNAKLFKMAEGDGLVYATNLEKTHAFDWAVFNNLNKVDFYYRGGKRRKSLEDAALASIAFGFSLVPGLF